MEIGLEALDSNVVLITITWTKLVSCVKCLAGFGVPQSGQINVRQDDETRQQPARSSSFNSAKF